MQGTKNALREAVEAGGLMGFLLAWEWDPM